MDQNPNQNINTLKRAEILQDPPPAPISDLSKCLDQIKKNLEKQGSIGGIWQDWPKIAGPDLARFCQPLFIRRGVLTIGATHPHWRQALLYNRIQLLISLKRKGHQVKDLRIKQHHPSKAKLPESELITWQQHPSRIDIHGTSHCKRCGSPAPSGELKLWGECSFCRRQKI